MIPPHLRNQAPTRLLEGEGCAGEALLKIDPRKREALMAAVDAGEPPRDVLKRLEVAEVYELFIQSRSFMSFVAIDGRPAYFGSKKMARIAVPPTFSVVCSSASRHIDPPAGHSSSSASPEGVVTFPLPP